MTKKPEEVLEQDRITATTRIKEGSIKIAVEEKYCNGTSEYWQRQ